MRGQSMLAPRAKVLTKQSTPSFISRQTIFSSATRQSSTNKDNDKVNINETSSAQATKKPSALDDKPQKAQSMAQADEDLRRRLEEMSGEGGAAGIEYEDGKPQAMRRSVRNNMFRYI